ncbi:MAG: prolipoprotein diacylglyceryl transferase [Clostridia bacterium]|nr:prolipoprotein diacylglyceryl transferase [Clostridia bacterium]
MSATLFTLFGVPVTGYGLGAAAALLLSLIACLFYARKTGLAYGAFIRLAVVAIPLCWLMSRLVYVLANCTYYLITLSNPVLALHFWDGGYSAAGAVMGLILAGFLAEKWSRLPHGSLMDAMAYGLPLGLVVIRTLEGGTNLGLGRTVTYEWLYFLGVEDGYGDLVHPVYRYEAATALIILAILSIWLCKRRWRVRKGDTCLVSLTLLGAFQVVLESLRNDGHMVVHFVRIQQVLALVALVVAFAVFTTRLYRLGGMKKSHLLALWLVTIVCIGLGIFMEFRVDRGSLKLVYYAVMILCMALIATMALVSRRKAERLS